MAKNRKPIDKLHFAGTREQPDDLNKLITRRPEFGKGDAPKELRELQETYKIHLTGLEEEPKVKVSREKRVDKTTWELEIPVSERLRVGYIPGQKAERVEHEELLQEIDTNVNVSGYRPEWMDLFYQPRLPVQRQFDRMYRIDGTPVDPLIVFPPDDRWVFMDKSWPWGLVGKIETSSGWTGSGVLVGERLVATASHVVPWADAATGSWWMKFTPAYYNGQSLHGPSVYSYISDVKAFQNTSNVVGYDWAICRLYTPLGLSLGYFGYNGYSSSWNDLKVWSNIGYPASIASAQRPTYQTGFSIIDTDSDSNGGLEIESRTADLTPGNSGGPIFAWFSGDPRIVGVVSGQEQEYWFPFSIKWVNVFAGGSGFTNLCAWGRTNWPG